MSINSGRRYKITNEENGLSVDLFESYDNSIIGSDLHGAENQQVTNVVISISRPSYKMNPSSGSQ